METSGGIGSVGTYDAKISGGVLSLSLGAQIDLAAELLKAADKVSNATEKMLLQGAAAILKGIA